MPDDGRFAFRNAVHLADAAALAARHVDYVVWQKPYRYVANGLDVPVAADVATCGAAFEPRFGPPEHDDEWLAVYRVRHAADAQR